jgi:hypothetical protein
MSDPADDRSHPSDTMRERVPGSRYRVWFLIGADRRLVAGCIMLALFGAVVVVGEAHPTPAGTLLTRGDPVETLYQALVASTVTGVTLVLTIGQLVLSQELGAVGDQRERMEGATSFRRDVADAIGAEVAPAEPSAFLRGIVEASRRHGEALAEAVGAADRASDGHDTVVVDDEDADLAAVVAAYVDTLSENADVVADHLDGAQFGEFDVVWAALDYNYSWKLYAGRRIRERFGDELSESAAAHLDDLLTVLTLFGPAREHFKTLYFQWELSDLSRTLLYAAVPALAVAVVTLVFFDPRDVTGATLGVAHATVILAVTTTLSLAPFALLLSYVLRIVTVTKRTLSIGPFILRETDRSGDVEWK